MKRKKYMAKKPKFRRIWAVRFLVSFCIAIVICVIGTCIAVNFYRNYAGRQMDAAYEQAINRLKEDYNDIYNLEDLSEESKLEYWKTMIHWKCDIMQASLGTNAYTYRIYNANTHELMVKEEELTYIIFGKRVEGEKSRIYRCPVDTMRDMFSDYDDLWEKADLADGKRDGASNGGPEIQMLDFYLKDGSFLPGKMELRQLKDEYNEAEEAAYTVIKTYDYTPEDTSGYQHIMVDREAYRLLGPMWWGREKKNQDVVNLLEDYIENGDDMWETDLSGYSQSTFGGVKYIETDTVTIGGKLPVKIVLVVRYNLFENYGIWIGVTYAVVFAIAVLLSLAISYRTYMVQKNHYEMDAYRRETTNAMAHDLKTPLTAISGYAENLRDKVHTEKMDYYTEAILENVQYMNEMVGNILDLAQVENTEQKLNLETIHLKELTEEVLKKYEVLMEDRQLLVRIEGDGVIRADSSMMTQAIENLVGNAIKYSKEDTEVSIILTDVSFEMHNVMEMQPEIPAEELWKPFVKGDNSRNSQKGSGIGLTIVKNIADLHGYILTIKCESDKFIAGLYFKREKDRKKKSQVHHNV